MFRADAVETVWPALRERRPSEMTPLRWLDWRVELRSNRGRWTAQEPVGHRRCRRMEHMTSATIKLFLPRGDAKSLRTAEISNWTGKAVAAPRTELEELLAREELEKAGV